MQAQIKSKSAKSMLLALKQPFDTRFLKVRIGARTKDKSKGIALFYLDSREVQKRLDEVCGIDGWRSEMQETTEGVLCTISIRMPNGEWVSRTDGGEKSQVAPFKGACSDALKRAAAQFGIGRYLYYVPNSWHSLLNDGKTLPAKISGIKYDKNKTSMYISIREGRNRQIRRMIEKFGYKVLMLRREKIGELSLGDLPEGKYRELTKQEVEYLYSV